MRILDEPFAPRSALSGKRNLFAAKPEPTAGSSK